MINTRTLYLVNVIGTEVTNSLLLRRVDDAALVSDASLVLLHGLGRTPLGGVGSPGDLFVEQVDLFQAEALCLVDHTVDESDADEAAAEPDEENLGLEVGIALTKVDEVGSRVGNGPVEQPVGGGGDTERLGTSLERENLTSDNPGQGSPGGGKEEDVDADKGDGRLGCRFVVAVDLASDWVLDTGNGTGNSYNELGDSHTDGTEQQQWATSPFVSCIKTRDRGHNIDGRRDHGDDKLVLDTSALKVASSVVENEVDTSELLKHLEQATSDLALKNGGPETIEIGRGLGHADLVIVVGLYFVKLFFDGGMISRETTETTESFGSLFTLVLADEETRCFGKDQHATEQDQRPCELNSNGNSVASSVVMVLGGVIHDGSKQETNGDGKLVCTDDGATNPFGSRFGLVQRDCWDMH